MFVLDTNILSAMMRLQLEPQVAAWIAAQPPDLLFTTSLSQAEILSGLAIMAEGRRRLDLQAAACAMFLEDFDGRHRLRQYLRCSQTHRPTGCNA
jgi:toxin FitB